jgi:cation transport regulator
MPYPTLASLPDGVKVLPKHGQEIYQSAFNAAFKQYNDEAKAHATAWAAVKNKYENADGVWKAKEADVLTDLYAELVKQAGSRDKKDDTKRINLLVESCGSLLAEDKPDEAKVSEMTKEVEEALTWLKLQEIVKTEDGVEYPASAFAYVPDPDTPSTWKLRVWEDAQKKVTRAQLGRAAAALSPGGFRGQRVQIPESDVAGVKRKIRANYRRLDVDDADIPRWVKESESRALLEEMMPLEEAKLGDKGIAHLVVIKPGFNASKERYYPKATLERDYGVFEGVKMYADHPTDAEEKARPERSIRDWVATLKNVKAAEDGSVVGEAVVVEPWLQQRLATLRDQEMLKDMGVSINAVGVASKQDIEGQKTVYVEKLVKARSVDFVTEPGAGGGINVYESRAAVDIDLVDLEGLRDSRPDLVAEIVSETKQQTQEDLKMTKELEERIQTLEGETETLTKENDELKTKIEEAAVAKQKAEAKAGIEKAIGEAELPDATKTRLLEQFADAASDEGLKEAIEKEAEYIAALAHAGKVKDMGDTKADPEKGKEALKEAFKGMHPDWTDEQIEIAVKGR